MAALDPTPIPPELAEPSAGDDDWLAETVAYAAELADEMNLSGSTTGASLAADALAGQAGEDERLPEEARRWTVTDAGSAEWAMRHVAAAEAELAGLRAQADEWAGRIAAWFSRAAAPLAATKGFMEAHLERYALDRREANPKHKTLTLPAGRVSTTYTAPRVEVTDADAVVAWAEGEGLDDVVKVERRPLLTELRTHVHVGPWYVGVRVELSCGHDEALADSAEPPPEVGEMYTCSTGPCFGPCGAGDATYVTAVDVTLVAAAGLYEAGGVLYKAPGTTVAPEKVTAKVKAERP